MNRLNDVQVQSLIRAAARRAVVGQFISQFSSLFPDSVSEEKAAEILLEYVEAEPNGDDSQALAAVKKVTALMKTPADQQADRTKPETGKTHLP